MRLLVAFLALLLLGAAQAPTAVIAIEFEDGTVGRMQLFGKVTDAEIDAEVRKAAFSFSKPKRWVRVALDDFPKDYRYAWAMRDNRIFVDEGRLTWRDWLLLKWRSTGL